MEVLLEFGAKLNVKDMHRQTPQDHIRGRPKCSLVVTHHIGKYLYMHDLYNSLVPYGFDCDTVDQSTKFCIAIPLDIQNNFRRGATPKSPLYETQFYKTVKIKPIIFAYSISHTFK